MEPKAWSFTALESYENCPKQYFEVKIAKRFQDTPGKEMLWGRQVHEHFEQRIVNGVVLPAELEMHEEFLAEFCALPGEVAGEEKIALDTNLRPCAYFGKDVWFRGQVDARKRDIAAGHSHLLDHKTGKVKTDFRQLKLFAIWEFLANPQIHTIRAEYYWTQNRGATGQTFHREQLWALVREFLPPLQRFADSFKYDHWPPKQSGLCRGWCPVTNCEFWSPKRPKP